MRYVGGVCKARARYDRGTMRYACDEQVKNTRDVRVMYGRNICVFYESVTCEMRLCKHGKVNVC